MPRDSLNALPKNCHVRRAVYILPVHNASLATWSVKQALFSQSRPTLDPDGEQVLDGSGSGHFCNQNCKIFTDSYRANGSSNIDL